jgi:V/A-type H+-transporting ATPase subunit B
VRDLEDMVGTEALSETDRSYLRFAAEFERSVFNQAPAERREVGDTLDRMWQALGLLPRRELGMLPAAMIDRHIDKDASAP